MKDNNGNKKPSIWKRIAEWCSLTWLSFTTEVEDRIFMSWKRLLKFAGISLIPIIYGVICVIAFWNPIDGIGRAPMAVMDQDSSVLLVKDFEENEKTGTYTYNVGALMGIDEKIGDEAAAELGLTKDQYNISPSTGAIRINSSAILTTSAKNEVESKVKSAIESGAKLKLTTEGKVNPETGVAENETVIFDNKDSSFSLEIMSAWDLLKGSFLPKTDNDIKDTEYTFNTPEVKKDLALTNIHYINDQKTIDKELHGTKYYVQIRIPEGYTENYIQYMGEMLADPTKGSINNIVDTIEPM